MSPDFITEAVRTMTETYGKDHVRTATEGARTLVRVDDLELYPTCQPPSTPILVVLDPSQAKPVVYVGPGQLLVPWEEQHGILRFVAAARQRFTQDE